MRTRGQASTVVDTSLLASSFSVEEVKLQSVLDSPTVELVKEVLAAFTAHAQEFETTKAEKLRLEVEIENTVRNAEAKVKAVKSTLSKSQKEVEQLRTTIKNLEDSRADLQAQVDRANSTSTDSSSILETLQCRIASLETSNRETLAVVESKSVANDKLVEDLANQHQQILSLRRDFSSIEDKKQTLETALSSAKFKEQGLQQEIELLRRNVEWHEQELKTRAGEQTKFRKEKNARISDLQRANEDANNTIEILKRTEISLRRRIDELGQKAEDSFSAIQKLQEKLADAEAGFKVELESARRLADLQKQSADTARARLHDISTELERSRDDAAEEISQLQAEVETEKAYKETAEQRLTELETEIERLQSAQADGHRSSVSGTPARSTNGYIATTPTRGRSPLPFTPGTSRSKGKWNVTQLYSENNELRADLQAERQRTSALTIELDEMIKDLESRGPEQEDLRADKERMESEVVEMSSLLDAALAERDSALQEYRTAEGQINGLTKESEVLRQQLRDLSAQIKILLVEMQARDQGLGDLDAGSQASLQMLANGDVDEETLRDQTSAGSLITQRLLLYRNVSELQEQNQQLLKLNRGLADQMEGDEARAREAEQIDRMRELEDLQQRARQHYDEVRSLKTQMESITRERDMFRRMLANRGPLPVGVDLESEFGVSRNGDSNLTPRPSGRTMHEDPEHLSSQLADHVKLVKELQSHLDSTRRELNTDRDILRKQVDQLAKEKSDVQSELIRNQGQISLAQERYEMLQSNFKMLQTENVELQKRAHVLHENAAKQDIRTQQVAEELIDAKAVAESLRNEAANLKSERELAKKIESRLSEDNRQLLEERARLNKLVADLQNLQNEREQSDSENRRRLQNRIDSLEMEVSSLRKKVEDASEESRRAQMRREYEADQSKTRIDDLMKSLSNAREELVAARTARDQLHARVEEMRIDLRTAEERAQALQPRLTPRGPSASQQLSEAATAGDNTNLSREQELRLEVADLKRDLEFARSELETAKTQVEQYKAISQAAEEELQSFNDTNDQFKQDVDRQLEEKDGLVKQLEQRLQDMRSELTTTNAELSDLRTQQEQSSMQLELQKTELEGQVARLRDECERHLEKARLSQADLRAQAEIAQQAQSSYEDELVKHAEAAKLLQSIRSEHNLLRSEVAGIRADAEAARSSLTQGQETWSELRDNYEKELNELRSARDDLKAQNKLLHEQMESVSSQISTLQQHRAQLSIGGDETSPGQSVDNKLQEVVSYLRREKEIIDVQCELAVQESKRLKQQLDYTQTQLDETRTKLSEERREKASHDTGVANHTKLLETINELNLFRESSATLRAEARQAQAKLSERVEEVNNLTSQILPLKARIQELESEVEMKDGELKLLQEDRDRWRERTQNIISKYDRHDPSEIEAMKGKIAELEAERDTFQAERRELQQRIEEFPAKLQTIKDETITEWSDRNTKLIENAKRRDREKTAKINEVKQALADAHAERDKLQESVTQSKNELSQMMLQRDEAIAQKETAQAAIPAGTDRATDEAGSGEEGEVNEAYEVAAGTLPGPKDLANTGQSDSVEAQAHTSELANKVEELQAVIRKQTEHITELEKHIVDLQAQLEHAASQQRLQNGSQTESVEAESLRQQLSSAQQQLQRLQEQHSVNQTASTTVSATNPASGNAQDPGDGDIESVVAARVAAQVEQLKSELQAQHELSKQQLEAAFRSRTDKMKEMLNGKLKERTTQMKGEAETIRQALISQHSEEISALRKSHDDEISRLKEEHKSIVERVRREGAAAIEKARTSSAQHDATGISQDAATVTAAPDDPGSSGLPNLTDQQVKELVGKSEIVRKVISRNVSAKVEQASSRLAEEHKVALKEQEEAKSKELASALLKHAEELKAERDVAITKAVNMETTKQKAKLGMANAQAAAAKAKIEVVETAARETPLKPVGEVWEIAKVAKPTPAPAVTPAAPVNTATAQATSTSVPDQAAAAVKPLDEQSRLAARQAKFGITPAAPVGSFGKPSFVGNNQTPVTATPAGQIRRPSNAASQKITDNPNVAEATATESGATPKTTAAASRGVGMARPGGTMLPRPGAGRGRGGIPQPGQATTAPPQGASAASRGGGGIARGLFRGGPVRGGGRGGGGPGSPLNGAAKQFTPGPGPVDGAQPQLGAKRPLEGGEQGDDKRVKGEET